MGTVDISHLISRSPHEWRYSRLAFGEAHHLVRRPLAAPSSSGVRRPAKRRLDSGVSSSAYQLVAEQDQRPRASRRSAAWPVPVRYTSSASSAEFGVELRHRRSWGIGTIRRSPAAGESGRGPAGADDAGGNGESCQRPSHFPVDLDVVFGDGVRRQPGHRDRGRSDDPARRTSR